MKQLIQPCALLASCLLLFVPLEASACDCVPVQFEVGFASADAIFVGRIVSQESFDEEPSAPVTIRIVFQVCRSWRGITGNQVWRCHR